MSIVIGGVKGETVDSGRVIDKEYFVACDRHKTPVEMKYGGKTNKVGFFTKHYSCPKCYQVVDARDVLRTAEYHQKKQSLLKPTLL